VHIELQCPTCGCEFVHETALAGLRDQDRAEAEVLHDALGDGGTLEDSLHAVLSNCEEIGCPECDAYVPLREEDLGRLAMMMLASW
jgi:hypothetical protein